MQKRMNTTRCQQEEKREEREDERRECKWANGVYIGYLWGRKPSKMKEEAETDGQDGWAGGSWGSENFIQVKVRLPPHLPFKNRGIN